MQKTDNLIGESESFLAVLDQASPPRSAKQANPHLG